MMPALLLALVVLGAQPATESIEAQDAAFLKLTTEVNKALQLKDAAALDRTLGKDFGFSMFVEGKAPQVMNRNETLRTLDSLYKLEQFEIRNLAARVFGSVA